MPIDYSRIHRLLHTLLLMQQEEAGNAEDLARRFGVTERTVYRDLQILADIGVPHSFDAEAGGYRVARDFFLPPVHLTAGETLALLSLAQGIGTDEQIAMSGPALRAAEKIRGQLPRKVLDELGDIGQYIDINLPATGPPTEAIHDVFDLVRRAIGQRRALRCRYESLSPNANGDEFVLHPYALAFDQRAWYVVGHHAGRDAVRRLKLNRFTAVTPTDRPYAIPDDFCVTEFRGKAWRMIRGDRAYHVAIEFDPTVAETVADTNWHPTQQVEDHADGSITFRCEVEGLDEIVWWVLGYGPHAYVREPEELADRVVGLVRSTAEKYAANG